MKPRSPAVLLVEDDDTIRRLSRRLLESNGFSVTAVATGVEALGYLAQRFPIDILVVDLHLPDVHGLEIARRARRAQPALKVLYTTGFVDDLFAMTAFLGADEAFLEKPYNGRGLIEAVRLLSDEPLTFLSDVPLEPLH